MKRTALTTLIAVLLLTATTAVVWADKPIAYDAEGNEIGWAKSGCTRIQDGTIYASDGSLVTTGYNEWGYNYQAHMFNGMYCDYHPYYRPGGPGHDECVANYGDVHLMMKWSDVWLANTDCNGDGLLDRGYSCDPVNADNSACEGSWLTNHMRGESDAPDDWTYFVKIVVAPTDAYVDQPWYTEDGQTWGTYYAADGTQIGEQIWGAFAIIQQVESGSGATYVSPAGTGLGDW